MPYIRSLLKHQCSSHSHHKQCGRHSSEMCNATREPLWDIPPDWQCFHHQASPCQARHSIQINGAPQGDNLTSPAAATAVRSVALSHASSTPLVQKSAVLHPLPDSRGERRALPRPPPSAPPPPSASVRVHFVAGSDVIPRLNFTLCISPLSPFLPPSLPRLTCCRIPAHLLHIPLQNAGCRKRQGPPHHPAVIRNE